MDILTFPATAPRDPRIEPPLARALAYDRRNTNRRAVFAMTHSLVSTAGGDWSLSRRWTAVADELLCEERVRWNARDGLLESVSISPSMGERLEARRAPDSPREAPTLETSRVPGANLPSMERRLSLPRRGFTLASAPLEIAASWPALLRGERLRRQYLVLKVQRHAAVDLQAIEINDRSVTVALTPVALPLRWLFGRTLFHFRRSDVGLHAIDGLLDPRDRKPNGRWHEYLGRVEFLKPVSFSPIVAACEGAGGAP
ncbi:MAG: hypothetical protein O9303_08400 [Silanimonas sp.]|jgi:hypothetical protein|nr:hypothetical protein [Silanimonas sp.]